MSPDSDKIKVIHNIHRFFHGRKEPVHREVYIRCIIGGNIKRDKLSAAVVNMMLGLEIESGRKV